MHELEDALLLDVEESWASISVWRIDFDIPWPGYVTEMMTSAVVSITTHGVINWITNRGVRSVFFSTSLLTATTVSIINNLPYRRSKIEGELRFFNDTLYDLNQFEKISMNGSSTNSQGHYDTQYTWGRKSWNNDWERLSDTLDDIKKTIYRINEHTKNLKRALEDCICESQGNDSGNSHGNETFIDRSIKWITGTRDNVVTWVLGTIWDKFGIKAIRSALLSGNGWQLFGAAMLLYKVAEWILNVLRNIRKVIMQIVAVIQGFWWVYKLFWYLCRRDSSRLQQLFQSFASLKQQSAQKPPPQ